MPSTRPVTGRARGYIALDNYTPTRNDTVVDLTIHAANDITPQTVVLDATWMPRDAHDAVYLLDDGQTVRPHYVAGWASADPHSEITSQVHDIYLHPFPTSTGTRPDNGRPVDMSGWALGPRKAFHVKLRNIVGEW